MKLLLGTKSRLTKNVVNHQHFPPDKCNKKQLGWKYQSSSKILYTILVMLVLYGSEGFAQDPVITVRFNNPVYNFTTQNYKIDVEFQSNTPGKQLSTLNFRFLYDDIRLEYLTFGELSPGYFVSSCAKTTSSPAYGQQRFGFTGPYDFINASILHSGASVTTISTSSWTKLFCINFHVDDPVSQNMSNFCPSLVLDMRQDTTGWGMITPSGVGMTVYIAPPPSNSSEVIEHVIQYNWQYDGPPDPPYPPDASFGSPLSQNCITTRVAPKAKIDSLLGVAGDFVTFPVKVTNFFTIGAFTLTLNYNTSILDYCCVTPHASVSTNFGATVNETTGQLVMMSTGYNTTLPNGTALLNITFKYLGGNCALSWYDIGPTCLYVDATNSQVIWDSPMATYYINGNITSGQYVWTGNTSTNWNTTTNWQSNLVPTQFTNLTITSSPPPANWPTYPGNFVLGENCRNFTLTGDAQLTVNGNLTVNPGNALTNSPSGIIKVTGNWINSGGYVPSTGIVQFNGSTNSIIANGVSPANYVAGFVLSTFSPVMTAISGGSVGPTGDNAHSDINIGFDFNYLGVNYSQVRLNTNGWLSLNLSGEDASSNANDFLFTTNTPTTALAPWWDNLNADGASLVSYLTSGTAPNRVFIAEWKNILAYTTGSDTRLNFQVKLYETSNVIEFCYGTVSGTTHNPAESASIGIKDATGGPGNFKEPIYGTSNMVISCLVSNTDWPTVNYRFTPPIVNTQEVFHQIDVNKTVGGQLIIQKDTRVTGLN